jgi:hypothetical protein
MNEPFPPGVFDRAGESGDAHFYSWPRIVTHIDEGAIAAVGALYAELGLDGDVLDIISSWVSPFQRAPAQLTVLGMNRAELAENPQATSRVVHDLNEQPELPFADASFDAVVCCVSVDYLVRPIEVFQDSRVLRQTGDSSAPSRIGVFRPRRSVDGFPRPMSTLRHRRRVLPPVGRFREPVVERRTPPGHGGDPLFAVWGRSVDSRV